MNIDKNFENIDVPVKKYLKSGYNSYLPGWKWERMANVCTLYYIISGSVCFSLDDGEFVCGENDVFYLSSGERALISNKSKNEKVSLYYVVFEAFDENSLECLGIDRPTSDSELTLFNLFRNLYKTHLAEGPAYKILEFSEFLHLLYELTVHKLRSDDRLSTDKNLDRALRYMKMNFYKPITVEQLSKIAGYSSSHFRRIFTESYGVPPHEYLLNYRIERAKELLSEDEERSIDEIADIVGMCNSSYFCKIFKKRTGTSPHRFKKQSAESTLT